MVAVSEFVYANRELQQFVLFSLHDLYFAVPIQKVWRIVPYGPPTRVPHAPPYIEGLMNLHGEIVPVVNLKQRLALPDTPYDEEARILVVEMDEQRVGLAVDRVTAILRVPPSQIAPPPPTLEGIPLPFVTGIVTVDKHIVVILDVPFLLQTDNGNTTPTAPTLMSSATEEH